MTEVKQGILGGLVAALTVTAVGLLIAAQVTVPEVEPIPTVMPTAPTPLALPEQITEPPIEVATATAPATRNEPIQVTEPPPPPVPTGLHGLPFAPAGLDNCDEMMFYATQAGLPSAFRGLGWRESNCRNEEGVRTFCCWGYWQLYVSIHLADHRLRDPYHACGVFSRHDVDSDTPLDKQRQACAAKALLGVSGFGAW